MPDLITLEDRKNAVLQAMAAEDIDRLIIASSGRHMIDECDAVAHIAGFLCLGPSIVILTSDGRATLIATPAHDAERMATGLSGATCIPVKDLAVELRCCWGQSQAAQRVALVGIDSLPYRLAAQILEISYGATYFDRAFYAATPAKTAGEIENARRAAEIAERGWERLQQVAWPGMRECDLGIELNLYMRSQGANDSFLMLNTGPRSPGVMPSSQRCLQKGDLILSELSPSCGGQFVQICRTAYLGKPGDELTTRYDLLCNALGDGLAAVRPGTTLSAICDAIDQRVQAAGFGEYSRPPHLRRRGHGLGCGSTAPGDVAFDDNGTSVTEDMVFVVHPNQFLPGPGYLMCGDTVRVTASGAEVLSRNLAKLGIIDV